MKIFKLLLFLPFFSFGQSLDSDLTTLTNTTILGNKYSDVRANTFNLAIIQSKVSLLGSYPNPSFIPSFPWSKLTSIPTANSSTLGVIKLYTSTGSNTDGSMDQNSMTTALASKLSISSQSQNLFFASPNGSSGNPSFRSIVSADVPTLNQNTTGSSAKWTTARTLTITGDLSYTTSIDGSGNVTAAGTLPNVNNNVGSFGSSTSIPSFTVNSKGLITAASSNAVIAPASTLTGNLSISSFNAGTGASSSTFWRGDGTWSSSVGVSNSAANNELAKSNGTNLVASGLFSTVAGDMNLGTGLSGAGRNITADGSASNVSLQFNAKGTGNIAFIPGGSGNVIFGDQNTTNLRTLVGGYHFLESKVSSTNTVNDLLFLQISTTGTPAIGIGSRLVFAAQTVGAPSKNGSMIESISTNVGSGTESFDLSFKNMNAGAIATEVLRLTSTGAINIQRTITPAGTTGNQTINKVSGSVNFAAAASTLTVTNSLVTTSSLIICTVNATDATAKSAVAVISSGSFVITLNAAATAETKVAFLVLN